MHINLINMMKKKNMFMLKKNIVFLCLYLQVALFGFILFSPNLVLAQNDSSQPSTNSASQILQAPLPGDLTKDNRIFSPSRIFAKPAGAGVGYDLKERPGAKPSPVQLSTTIETKVENKTTNYVVVSKS